ncbi:MAG: class I SAM-dependent methyltransferase [Hyphomicrobiales bacterium]|nr:class I SAM-dependent methyltransferase [Hyphomicrobiales bacterium]
MKQVIRATGFDIVRFPPAEATPSFPLDFTDQDVDLYNKVRPYTLGEPIAVQMTANAVRYLVNGGIPGAIVECGVWRGGMMMAAAYTLLELGDTSRDIFLYDTFEGMPEPTEADVNFWGEPPFEATEGGRSVGAKSLEASLEDVRSALFSVGYPRNKIHFIKGCIEQTVPRIAPEKISFLRLDTCFYESTHHELIHFFPRLSSLGVLHIDDYGLWQGCRQAVNEFVDEARLNLFFVRIGRHGARVALKV